MKKMQSAMAVLALSVSAVASATTLNFNSGSGSYSTGGITATVTAAGGALYYSSNNSAIGVGSGLIDGPLGVTGTLIATSTTNESLTVSFNQAVTLNSIAFAQWSDIGLADSVQLTYAGGSIALVNSGNTGLFSPGVSLTSFTLTPNQGGLNSSFGVITTNTFLKSIDVTATSAVPIPGAAWLLGSGLTGLVGFARRKKAV
jgi:hypothetical protein